MKNKFPEWTKTENHIYNKDVVKCDVYAKSFGRGTVYLMDKEHFTYTCSFGASSDYSFTGCFFQLPVNNVNDCMKALDKFVPLWLSDKTACKIEPFINS